MKINIPKNVFSAFGVLFLITTIIVPLQNLVVWGPDFVLGFYISPEFTAEKLSIVIIGLGVFMFYIAHKKRNEVFQ